jgi:hypothetical protein
MVCDSSDKYSFTAAYSLGWTFGLPFRGSFIPYIHTVGLLWTSEARHRDLYLHRTTQHINTRHKHPCPERDSNSQLLQPSGRRTTSYTARPLGPAVIQIRKHVMCCTFNAVELQNVFKIETYVSFRIQL